MIGSIYDGFSPKGQRALAQLRDEFRAAGFYAEKERRTERSLRVYPERRAKYPLLNPWLASPRSGSAIPVKAPSVVIPIYSDGDGLITRMLAGVPPIEGCSFAAGNRRSARYLYHGHFAVPLRLGGSARDPAVDFAALRPVFEALHLHLSSGGF